MMDEARRRGIRSIPKLSERLGVPVVETVAVRNTGIENLLRALDQEKYTVPQTELSGLKGGHHQKIETIFRDVVNFVDQEDKRTDFLDKIFLHPVLGLISLAVMMFIVFQAVFAWAAPFMDGIESLWLVGKPWGNTFPSHCYKVWWWMALLQGWWCGGVPATNPDLVLLYSGAGRIGFTCHGQRSC